MRYLILEYVDMPDRHGKFYQIHDADGNFVRFATLDGDTIASHPPFQAHMIDADAPVPAWG